MCLGDASTTASARMVKTYGDYLKSDMVQIAHHGYEGGTSSLYSNIGATVNIWPVGRGALYTVAKLIEKDYNKSAINLKTVKETFVAADGVFTFALPYTPDPSHQNTLIEG